MPLLFLLKSSALTVAAQCFVCTNFADTLFVPAKEKLCYSKCPLLLPTAICPLQGLFVTTSYFAKSHALAVFDYKSYGSCESCRSSGFGGEDEAAELTVSSSESHCLSRIF